MDFLNFLGTVFGIMIIPMLALFIFHLQDKHHEREIEKIYQKYGYSKKPIKVKRSSVRTDDIEDINERK